jgi:hypothetical protein
MLDGIIRRYELRFAEEKRLAEEAGKPDISLAHHQLAMLYKTELTIMRRKRAVTVAETLAQIC